MSPGSALLHEEPLSAAQLLARDIRALRKARGLTLAEIGQRLKRSIGWLSQVERGLSAPSLADLRAFAELFGVPLSLFFGHEAQTDAERGVVATAPATAAAPASRDSTSAQPRSDRTGPSFATRFIPSRIGFTSRTSARP